MDVVFSDKAIFHYFQVSNMKIVCHLHTSSVHIFHMITSSSKIATLGKELFNWTNFEELRTTQMGIESKTGFAELVNLIIFKNELNDNTDYIARLAGFDF